MKVSSKDVILSASLLVACMALLFPRMAGAQSFNYPDFSSASLAATPLQINGNAAAPVTGLEGAAVLRLTTATPAQSGSAFSLNSIRLEANAGFSTAFAFQLSNGGGKDNDGNQPPEPPGADGIVFVLTTVANNVGALGQGVGYQGITNSVGIKFDTWQDGVSNGFPQDSDPNGNFVAVYTNGSTQTAGYIPYAASNSESAPQYYSPATYLKNGDVWYAWIDYNGATGELDVRLTDGNSARPTNPQLSQTIQLANPAILGSFPNVFAGFTSATGEQYQNQDILNWEFVDNYSPIGTNLCGPVIHSNTTYTLNESWLYAQTNAGPPVPSPIIPYGVIAEVSLVSNLSATAASVTSPNGTVTTLQNIEAGGQAFLAADDLMSARALNAAWPNGNYTFNVSGASLPAVTFSWDIAQPNTPQLANFAAVQAVDSTKSFTLSWNAFTNKVGTNEISVNIGYDSCAGTGFSALLPSTATSTTIPAGTLAPGSNYVNCTLGFINAIGVTNASPQYSAGGSHGSITSFTLTTIGAGASGSLNFGTPLWSRGSLTLPITAPPGKSITVETSTTLKPDSWKTLTVVNSGAGTITVTDTPPKTVLYRFYRAHD